MITRYRDFLEFLDIKLAKMFEEQKAFIKCKKGCSYCCKNGEYPVSELEYVNMMFYYGNLDETTKDRINKKVADLLESKREKMYECPFLINNECSIYPARAIICRTFGLLSFDKNNKKRMPFCVNLGLNYANVYDEKEDIITSNAEDGSEPLAYNIDRQFLRSNKIEKNFNIFFGDDKPLIEWLSEEFQS